MPVTVQASYLWWVNGFDIPVESLQRARGAVGKYIVVIPERDARAVTRGNLK